MKFYRTGQVTKERKDASHKERNKHMNKCVRGTEYILQPSVLQVSCETSNSYLHYHQLDLFSNINFRKGDQKTKK